MENEGLGDWGEVQGRGMRTEEDSRMGMEGIKLGKTMDDEER